jgi:hypothetical protein
VRVTGFVSYRNREGYLLNGVPAPLMRRLTKKAIKQNTSLTNVAGSILAEAYGVEFEESTRSKPASNVEATVISLRLPVEVLNAIRAGANERSITIRSVILEILSLSFGLKAPEPTHVDPDKRPGRPKEK